ncbi:CAP-Gly domain-containing linker protein 4-like [Watersipora subatra]|uniref:CAP-Gly domain-containing linker protein 4-like n=1 Tax=Watersipora subatra TaxID=2589382 RepID=UPI00355AFE3C
MISMESHHSDTSLSSTARESSSWVKLWHANCNATGGLNISQNGGSATDLASAIGDKEVVAKAVAFVVNSTRKGIVPLCADVANLLSNRRSLEDRIVQLTKQNEALQLLADSQGSTTGSTSTRAKLPPLPGELGISETISPTASPTSRNLRSASLRTSGRKPNKPELTNDSSNDIVALPASPPQYSFMPVTPATKSSSRADNEIIIHPRPSDDQHLPTVNTGITVAEVHALPESVQESGEYKSGADWPRSPARTPSLSSSERDSDRSLERTVVSERRSTISKKLGKTVLLNNKLTEELDAARATIEKLQREVRDLRAYCKHNNHDGSVNGQVAFLQGSAPDVLPPHRCHQSSRSKTVGSVSSTLSCQTCREAQLAAGSNGAHIPRLLNHDHITLFTRENMLVTLEDSILTNSNQCGTVQYIGHLDGFASTLLFVGLQLADKVEGGLDGSLNGKRYFTCPKGCGIFIRAQDIVNVITKKQASVFHKSKKPIVPPPHPDKSVVSSSNSGSTGGFVGKLRRAAVNIRHTHSQKRISLPGDAEESNELRQSLKASSGERKSSCNTHRQTQRERDLPDGVV